MTQERRAPSHDGGLAADQDGGAFFLARSQGLRHQIDAVHAAGAVLIVDFQFFSVPYHALRRAEVADLLLDIEAR